MLKIIVPAFCATLLFGTASGSLAAAPESFHSLKGTTVSASMLHDYEGGSGIMMEGVVAKQAGHSGANYVLKDNTGLVALHIPSAALSGSQLEGEYCRVYGHIDKVAGGMPMLSVNQVETAG